MAYAVDPRARLGAVHLTVADLQHTLEFYTEALGLRVLTRDDNMVALTADGAEPLVRLSLNPEAQERALPSVGLRYFVLVLPDEEEVEKLFAHLQSVRATFARQGGCLFLRDPSENAIAIVPGYSAGVVEILTELEENLRPS